MEENTLMTSVVCLGLQFVFTGTSSMAALSGNVLNSGHNSPLFMSILHCVFTLSIWDYKRVNRSKQPMGGIRESWLVQYCCLRDIGGLPRFRMDLATGVCGYILCLVVVLGGNWGGSWRGSWSTLDSGGHTQWTNILIKKKRDLLSPSSLLELCTSNHPLFHKNSDGRGQLLTCNAVAKARTCKNIILAYISALFWWHSLAHTFLFLLHMCIDSYVH